MIIFITTSKITDTGGIQEYNRNVLKALGDIGVEVEIIELHKNNLLFKLFFIIKFIFKVIIKRPKTIFCAHVNISPVCFFIKKILGIDYIIFTHGTDIWNIQNDIIIESLKSAKRIITVSEFTKNKIIEQIETIEDKIFLLPNTINKDKFYPKERPEKLIDEYNLKDKKVLFTLARLSRLEDYKGYDKVLRVMPSILEKFPNLVYIIGGSGEGLKDVNKLVKSLDLEEKVITPGFIPDEELVDYYNLANVFVMPSKKDGFGIVFLESLACGTPVIAGNKDGSVDPLQKGKVGTLIDPDNTKEIEMAILKVLSNSIDNNLIDKDFLRNQTIKKYGFNKFKSKLKKLISIL